MFLNIVTPCSRPSNLQYIADSINIPRDNYRWIVVFDNHTIAENVPAIAECYAYREDGSVCGNAQRNYALDRVVERGHVYFNDDDTTIHPDLWQNINGLNNDFISFRQMEKNGKLRLDGKNISLSHIDSHNFIAHSSLIGNLRWVKHRRDADGLLAHECKKRSSSYLYIDKVLSVYNSLRN